MLFPLFYVVMLFRHVLNHTLLPILNLEHKPTCSLLFVCPSYSVFFLIPLDLPLHSFLLSHCSLPYTQSKRRTVMVILQSYVSLNAVLTFMDLKGFCLILWSSSHTSLIMHHSLSVPIMLRCNALHYAMPIMLNPYALPVIML